MRRPTKSPLLVQTPPQETDRYVWALLHDLAEPKGYARVEIFTGERRLPAPPAWTYRTGAAAGGHI